ncbi:hypothetical protein GCM10007063_34210 [Lentibacillus kapialis]|uniref:Uncharacterized protein n=1 Tax=Lentibacillus kapialis TaxID=340214 RepID=A0A917V1H8_9BACI|nr:hypothetical protein [Lentibacillus kapialis]GGK08918.1 hypothetical protein GCM10007063_34210 [Lentibacillus kapialis]
MFGLGFYNVFIIAGILGVQYFFSTRDSVYWGALIPLIFIVWRTWLLFTGNENILAYVLTRVSHPDKSIKKRHENG